MSNTCQTDEETSSTNMFVAIDRATRWVFVAIKKDKTAVRARSFLNELHNNCLVKSSEVLTNNIKEFTVRLFASSEPQPTGHNELGTLCCEMGIAPRLTKSMSPRTKVMVEALNWQIGDMRQIKCFGTFLDLRQTLLR